MQLGPLFLSSFCKPNVHTASVTAAAAPHKCKQLTTCTHAWWLAWLPQAAVLGLAQLSHSREVLALNNEGLILLECMLCLVPLQQLLELRAPAPCEIVLSACSHVGGGGLWSGGGCCRGRALLLCVGISSCKKVQSTCLLDELGNLCITWRQCVAIDVA